MTPDDLVAMYESAPDPPALCGLSQVDWSAVHHAYGPATDIPALLRAFVSDVADHREFACQLLFQTIWHSETVYDATATVVPFLYGLLEAHGVPNKGDVAHLIATVANGNSYLQCHTRTQESAATWESILAERGTTLGAEKARELGHVAAVKRAVARRLDLLAPYLRDPEPVVRWSVVIAVGCFPEFAARLLPDLRAAHQDETDGDAREVLSELIERLTIR